MSYIVYICQFPNGKVYIGRSSKPLEKRRAEHYNHHKNPKTIFHKALWSLGKVNFYLLQWAILHETNQLQESMVLEIEEIQKHLSTHRRCGYNQLLGGGGTTGYNWALDDVSNIKFRSTKLINSTKKLLSICKEAGYTEFNGIEDVMSGAMSAIQIALNEILQNNGRHKQILKVNVNKLYKQQSFIPTAKVQNITMYTIYKKERSEMLAKRKEIIARVKAKKKLKAASTQKNLEQFQLDSVLNVPVT